MKIKIKQVREFTVKRSGMKLGIHKRSGKHIGDLSINETGIAWKPTRKGSKSTVRVKWDDIGKGHFKKR